MGIRQETYVGGVSQGIIDTRSLAEAQIQAQGRLDAFLDKNFDFKAFIRNGVNTTITGTQIGTFIANINNNYRLKRIAIVALSTNDACDAFDETSGWPNNP